MQCRMQNAERRMIRMMRKTHNPIEEKSFAFAVRAVRLYKHLSEEKREYVISKQFLRSGTSVGANVSEAERGQSKADFHSKMSVALKEANETQYWLKLLYATDYLNEAEFNSVNRDIDEIISILVAICRSTDEKNK